MFLDPLLPAPPRGARIEFWTPVNKQPEPVLILSRAIVAHFVHFDGRTVPCLLQCDAQGEVVTPCPKCDEGKHPRRWKGYLNVWRIHAGESVFLCLPQGAGELLQQTHGMEFDYRGLRAKVSRIGGAKNKPLVVDVDVNVARQRELPAELAPDAYLLTLFRLKRFLPERQ